MVDRVVGRVGRAVALAGVVTSLFASMVLFAAPSASASIYCWGKVLTNYGECRGIERKAIEVWGMGNEKSVCVALAPFGPIKCSSGPNQWVQDYYGQELRGEPWIADNAAGKTTVWGESF